MGLSALTYLYSRCKRCFKHIQGEAKDLSGKKRNEGIHGCEFCKGMKKVSWFAFFLILTVSCLDEPDCFQLHNNILGVTFRVIGTGQGDSVVLKDAKNEWVTVTSFQDSLNYFVNEGTFIFEAKKWTKRLSFAYDTRNQFISEECGSSFELSDLRVVAHEFDSVRIVNSSPTKTGGPNIDIYRCPETDTLVLEFYQLLGTTNGVTISNPQAGYRSHEFVSITDVDGNTLFSGTAASVKLPVDLQKNSARYVFETAESNDTIEVTYTRTTEERYKPCGVQTFVNNLTFGNHTFDSLSYGLDNLDEPIRALLDPHAVNLRVFDCPPTNLLKVDFITSTKALKAVTVNSITGDHFEGDLITEPITTNSVTLSVDLNSTESTFRIVHSDNIVETLSVQYTKSSLTLFNACSNPVITGLREATDVTNINIPTNATTLQFPAVKNVEITVN